MRRKTGDFVENLLDSALSRSNLSAPDRSLCQELVYGVVRWQATLDWLIGQKTDNRPQKPILRELLRLGLYQIFWLDRIPNHAAVNETVASAKRHGFTSQAGFINAILRGFLREFDATKKSLAELKATRPALGFSHPEWLVERWERRWGRERTISLLEWNNTPPKTFARINLLKADPAKLLAQWRKENVEYDFIRHDWFPENLVFQFKSHPPLSQLPSLQQGLFYVQDPSTLLAVHALAPKPGEAILDLCAAPGGKCTYMAQLVQNQARIIAHDVSPERLKLVEQNCARLGVTCVQVQGSSSRGNETPIFGANELSEKDQSLVTSAATTSKAISRIGDQFDRILVDAPCSNTGVLRRRLDLRWRIQPAEIVRLRQLQLDLLSQAVPLLKPGGILVYSTCSLEPEENEEVTQQFLQANSAFTLESQRCLLPFADGTDGAYVARLVRH